MNYAFVIDPPPVCIIYTRLVYVVPQNHIHMMQGRLHWFYYYFPCRVALMTADRPSPRLLSVQYFSSWHASFHLVFDRRLFPFPGISALNTLLSSSTLLITCYHCTSSIVSPWCFWKPVSLSPLFLWCYDINHNILFIFIALACGAKHDAGAQLNTVVMSRILLLGNYAHWDIKVLCHGVTGPFAE